MSDRRIGNCINGSKQRASERTFDERRRSINAPMCSIYDPDARNGNFELIEWLVAANEPANVNTAVLFAAHFRPFRRFRNRFRKVTGRHGP